MLATINDFFGGEFARLLSSVAVIIAAIFFNHLNVRYQTAPARVLSRGSQGRQQLVLIKNVIILTAVCLIIMIWATKIVGIALSLSAFAMALVLSTKELIMCITGYTLFALSRPFNVGDHVELSGVQGLVVDVDLLNLTLSETNGSHQITGKSIILPNSVLLSAVISNNSSLNTYVIGNVRLAVPYATPREAFTQLAIKVATEVCEPWSQDSLMHFQRLGSIALLETPSNKVEVFWHPVDTKQHWVEIRYTVPVAQQEHVAQRIQNQIWLRYGDELIAANRS
ncbi:small-conductance mechanosensitive channel [Paenalcaligenes hominis]|uniref:Small-conductance mechanosensitive channel n=1 Tax=Paenalcaligenes hominis TaxID=643674 RepID=A0ABX0WSX4_9BURK|nr:mechanosensitive ion channel family protein [Paenalcaligenes hominis]NJB65869.1 small-conductance mechanosensitive channel [Paenalcaligenes hominis]GGE70323.1 membrane protein [Paenalcaligenes hominis]